jgi:uncharacterized protein (DUF1778 family)
LVGEVMTMETSSETTLDLRLPSLLKEVLKEAAAHAGQSLDEFAVSVLARGARDVIEHRGETVLTTRDWERFIAWIDDLDAEPNEALKAAAASYERHFG